ncbi:unnamed protein product [Rotaria socialis]|uniref:Uncharacterized protein n=1 Tax=Rotaria socialis TaxID=392032 RepID=A0A821VNB1_9BILA|nr:unnamed protein product [Rotaria socialis]CAF4911128.1 unnamed protein product [Rotaria socialis]
MFGNLEIAELSSSNAGPRTQLNLHTSVVHKIYKNIEEINAYVRTHSSILLFCVLVNLNDQNIHVDLDYLISEYCVLAIFVSGSLPYNSQLNGQKIFPVQKELAASKIKSGIIQCLKKAARERLQLNDIMGGLFLMWKSHDLEHTMFTNSQVDPCHVLIIPLNTTYGNGTDFQCSFITLCNNLFPDYKPIVSPIYDYLPPNDNNDFYENPDANILCNYVKNTFPIRIYLIGNETCIPDSMCKYIFEHDETYTLVENEPISDNIRMNLHTIINFGRSLTHPIKQLYEFENDCEFFCAMKRADADRKERIKRAALEMGRQIAIRSESPIGFSNKARRTIKSKSLLSVI